jgi:hypothetical protein
VSFGVGYGITIYMAVQVILNFLWWKHSHITQATMLLPSVIWKFWHSVCYTSFSLESLGSLIPEASCPEIACPLSLQAIPRMFT